MLSNDGIGPNIYVSTTAVWSLSFHHSIHPNKTKKISVTMLEKKTTSIGNQQRLTHVSSTGNLELVSKAYLDQSIISTHSKRELGNPMLSVRLDDDDTYRVSQNRCKPLI